MKIAPKQYAKLLVETATSENITKVSRKIWFMLQKRKQYKDFHHILEEIDEVYAEKNSSLLAKVYSSDPLENKQLQNIKASLEKTINKKIYVKELVIKNTTGIIAKVDGRIFDLSLEGKIQRLKQELK